MLRVYCGYRHSTKSDICSSQIHPAKSRTLAVGLKKPQHMGIVKTLALFLFSAVRGGWRALTMTTTTGKTGTTDDGEVEGVDEPHCPLAATNRVRVFPCLERSL